MAAELSTGLPVMAETIETGKKWAMLVTDMKATFIKKADDEVIFSCEPHDVIVNAIAEAMKKSEPVKFKLASRGKMKNDVVVAEFEFEWSLKMKA